MRGPSLWDIETHIFSNRHCFSNVNSVCQNKFPPASSTFAILEILIVATFRDSHRKAKAKIFLQRDPGQCINIWKHGGTEFPFAGKKKKAHNWHLLDGKWKSKPLFSLKASSPLTCTILPWDEPPLREWLPPFPSPAVCSLLHDTTMLIWFMAPPPHLRPKETAPLQSPPSAA